ncbi:MAG: hypothetical protein ACLPSW_23745 [Roseiarcus sp.]
MTKRVYSFGAARTESKGATRDLLGGKGANLAEMAALGLLMPPGFADYDIATKQGHYRGRGIPGLVALAIVFLPRAIFVAGAWGASYAA